MLFSFDYMCSQSYTGFLIINKIKIYIYNLIKKLKNIHVYSFGILINKEIYKILVLNYNN